MYRKLILAPILAMNTHLINRTGVTPGGGCLKDISDTKDLLLAGAFKIHV